jgi:gamma-glutamyltranspeptidase/glutathione hydrolase
MRASVGLRVISGVVAITAILAGPGPVHGAHPQSVRGSGGAVASAERAATEVGLQILRDGGNAVDAAVATALALAVVHPGAGNLGGGGFAVVRFGTEVDTLDFRETAPAAASRDMYLGSDGEPVPKRSWVGPLAAGVPGSPVGLHELHGRYGRLPWQRVVSPAERLAGDGFVVSERLAREIAGSLELLQLFPETANVWLPGGSPPAAGTVMKLPQLATTLRHYRNDGPPALTQGAAAAAIETVARRYGGVLRAEDLAAYRAVWRRPVLFDAFGWKCASMSLPSSGGIILGQTFAMLERLRWAELPRFGADRVHLLAEVWRRSFADRYRLGDPRTTQADASELLASRWLDRRAREIRLHRATPSDKVRPWTEEDVREPAATTHLSVVDAAGNAVGLTTTLNGRFGCGLLVPGVGILLNNEMDDFATAPGRPNEYGLVQGEANAVVAGKRMLSSMAPIVAWRGEQLLVLGARGGSKIPTSTAQVFLNVVVDGDDLQAAVDRPRVHHQWRPDTLMVEPDSLSPETVRVLAQRGHSLEELATAEQQPKVNAVQRLPGGLLAAAADPRGPGAAGVVKPAPGS